jgi:phage virion morphogenesis protein
MTASDLQALEDWAAPLLTSLDDGERRQLARTLATELRRSQRDRIRSQHNPDGTRYEPRKRLRGRSGGIRRRAMFQQLATTRYLKARGDSDQVTVGFFGRVARIAAVHQYGRRDKIDRNGPVYDYPARELLGFSDHDRALIRDLLIDHLGV